MLPPIVDLSMVESGVIMSCPGSDSIMLRGISLDGDPPWTGATPGSPCHLAEKLEGAFASAKIRKVKDSVSRDYPYQGYQRKV